jgi:hypothetical protein
MTPVIALARSEAMMVAAFATSATLGNRPSKVSLPESARTSSNDLPVALACSSSVSCTSGVSGDPADPTTTSRTPCGPSSAANVRHRPSIAAQAVSKPPTLGKALRAGPR